MWIKNLVKKKSSLRDFFFNSWYYLLRSLNLRWHMTLICVSDVNKSTNYQPADMGAPLFARFSGLTKFMILLKHRKTDL